MKIGACQSAVLIVLIGGIGFAVPAWAAGGKPQPQPYPVVLAKAHVDQARKEADAANAALISAQAALKKAEDHAKEVRKKVEVEFDSAPELVAARAQFKKYDDEFTQLKGPLMKQLQNQADYQAALTAKEAAKKKGPKEFSDATAKVKEMAMAAINASAPAKAAYAGKTESEAKLQELLKKRNAAMEQDSRITSLKGDHDKAKAAVAQALTKQANERRQLADAQQTLKQEEQKAQQFKPQPYKRQ
jgi:hypothetical protein